MSPVSRPPLLLTRPRAGSERFAAQFRAEHFNPDQWADLFKKSGARYIVLTSKHHDGFALFPSAYSPRTS